MRVIVPECVSFCNDPHRCHRKAKVFVCVSIIVGGCLQHVTMQSSRPTAIHTHTHTHTHIQAQIPSKCDDIVPSPPQLSPCCSPTVDWWTCCRQFSPPPLLHPFLHQPVLLQPCCAAAIFSCPPSLPCNVFTLLRYTSALLLSQLQDRPYHSQGQDTEHTVNWSTDSDVQNTKHKLDLPHTYHRKAVVYNIVLSSLLSACTAGIIHSYLQWEVSS